MSSATSPSPSVGMFYMSCLQAFLPPFHQGLQINLDDDEVKYCTRRVLYVKAYSSIFKQQTVEGVL